MAPLLGSIERRDAIFIRPEKPSPGLYPKPALAACRLIADDATWEGYRVHAYQLTRRAGNVIGQKMPIHLP